jgi:hypothetical protein
MSIYAEGVILHYILKPGSQYFDIFISCQYLLPLMGDDCKKVGSSFYSCTSVLHSSPPQVKFPVFAKDGKYG